MAHAMHVFLLRDGVPAYRSTSLNEACPRNILLAGSTTHEPGTGRMNAARASTQADRDSAEVYGVEAGLEM